MPRAQIIFSIDFSGDKHPLYEVFERVKAGGVYIYDEAHDVHQYLGGLTRLGVAGNTYALEVDVLRNYVMDMPKVSDDASSLKYADVTDTERIILSQVEGKTIFVGASPKPLRQFSLTGEDPNGPDDVWGFPSLIRNLGK